MSISHRVNRYLLSFVIYNIVIFPLSGPVFYQSFLLSPKGNNRRNRRHVVSHAAIRARSRRWNFHLQPWTILYSYTQIRKYRPTTRRDLMLWYAHINGAPEYDDGINVNILGRDFTRNSKSAKLCYRRSHTGTVVARFRPQCTHHPVDPVDCDLVCFDENVWLMDHPGICLGRLLRAELFSKSKL